MYSVSGSSSAPSKSRTASAMGMLAVLPIAVLIIALPWSVVFATLISLVVLTGLAGGLVHTTRAH